nr:MAG TPA: hypothetical protein [Caudoviricetes sp.]
MNPHPAHDQCVIQFESCGFSPLVNQRGRVQALGDRGLEQHHRLQSPTKSQTPWPHRRAPVSGIFPDRKKGTDRWNQPARRPGRDRASTS